jgi:hypothetical protein
MGRQKLDHRPRRLLRAGTRLAPSRAPRLPKLVITLRNRAEEYLEKARGISDRQCARLLLVQANNYLKCAEET